jgi:hypothetical protein
MQIQPHMFGAKSSVRHWVALLSFSNTRQRYLSVISNRRLPQSTEG